MYLPSKVICRDTMKKVELRGPFGSNKHKHDVFEQQRTQTLVDTMMEPLRNYFHTPLPGRALTFWYKICPVCSYHQHLEDGAEHC